MNASLELPGGSTPGLMPSRFAVTLHSALRGSRYSDCQQGDFCTAALTIIRSHRRQP